MSTDGKPLGLTEDFATMRTRMVATDLRQRGITDERVLAAMESVPRQRFVPSEMAKFAYENRPLPIAEGQTISQPYVVGLMVQALGLDADSRVLEIGTGSGYGAAVLSRTAASVVSIERHEALSNAARETIKAIGYDNVSVIHGDGTIGYPGAWHFDAIVVTAGGPTVPNSLLEQLADGGRLVMPVGSAPRSQNLLRVTRSGEEYQEENLGAVRFVPLIGAEGWGTQSPMP